MNLNAPARAEDKATLETVTQVHRWTDSLFSIETTRPQGYDFVPGQYSRLGLESGTGGNIIWRAFSVVSAPGDDYLEYYGVLVPGGLFTTMLKDIHAGDAMWIEKQRYGFMTIDRFTDGEHLWMLSTGTGLGPFVSILRDPEVWRKFRELVVVHCARHAAELSYGEELQALAAHPPGGGPARLQLIQSVTRDPEGAGEAGILRGRITTLLENGELERQAGLALTPESSRIMLCGNPQMIDEVRKMLHQRGMRPVRRTLPGQFVTENYW